MFSGSNSNNPTGALVKKNKLLRKQRREFLRATFVSYSLSTSRLPHTYLPTLGLYKYFAERSVEGTLGIPKPLAVQVLSYLYCIAANEMSACTANNIISIVLSTFKAAYINYVDPVPLGSGGMKDNQIKSTDFIMYTLTARIEMGYVFKKNYPGSFNRLEYVIKNLLFEYDQNPFAVPYSFISKLDPTDRDTIATSLRLLKNYKDAKSPEYETFKRYINTFGYAAKKPEIDNGIEIQVETETFPASTQVGTRKRSNSADSYFGQPGKFFNEKQLLNSTPSSLNLKQQEESDTYLLSRVKY